MGNRRKAVIEVDTIAEIAAFGFTSKPIIYCLEDRNIYGFNGVTPIILGSWNGGQPNNTNLANAFIEEEFLGGALHNANNPLRWNLTTSGGGSVGAAASYDDHIGVCFIATNNVAGTPSSLNLLLQGSFNLARIVRDFDAYFVVKANGGFDADLSLCIGLADSDSLTPNNSVTFEKGVGDAAFFAVCRSGGAATRSTMGIGATATWYVMRIRRVGANIGFSINGGAEVIITTNIPTVGLTAQFRIDTAGAVAKSLEIDYFSLAYSGLARF